MLPFQNGTMPVHYASEKGHTAVVQLLVEYKTKLDIKNNVSVEVLVTCMGMGS